MKTSAMDETTYNAVVCSALGPPEGLKLQRLPRARLAPGTLRVQIKAAGINFPDILIIQGKYQHRPELPFVPGMEAAGIVTEVGANLDGGRLGQRVIVRLHTGGYAEEAVVAPDQISELPARLSFVEGATFLVAHLTAYHALATRAAFAPGQALLVLGAAGGVGLATVQIGKALGGLVMAAASSEEKLEAARRAGADHLINYTDEPIDAAVKRITSGDGVDVVFDPVGVAGEQALRCVAEQGKLLVVGFAAGTIPSYAANRILLKSCSVVGVRAGEAGRRSADMRRDELETLFSLASQGVIRPLVTATYPLHRYTEAMRLLADRRSVGRVALTND
jgi:NADPH:quinone reductase